jgi:hypothetical protein
MEASMAANPNPILIKAYLKSLLKSLDAKKAAAEKSPKSTVENTNGKNDE